MLEKQSKRGISLIKVVHTCREEACKIEEIQNQIIPVLSPCSNCQSPQDSGIGSGNERTSSNGSRNSRLRSSSNSVQKVRLRGKRQCPKTGVAAEDGRNNKRKASCSNGIETPCRTNRRVKRVKHSSTYTWAEYCRETTDCVVWVCHGRYLWMWQGEWDEAIHINHDSKILDECDLCQMYVHWKYRTGQDVDNITGQLLLLWKASSTTENINILGHRKNCKYYNAI